MRKTALLFLLAAGAAVSAGAEPVRLVTLDPGHFHAGLIQKEMYPGVDPTVHVYAPLGPDLLAHLARVSAFNARAEKPTSWKLEVHAGPDFMERMLREKPGNVVVLSGRNKGKMDRIEACVNAGMNVLADKPWLIESADFPKLERTLAAAEAKGLVAYDVMTERYEVTTILQRDVAADRDVAGPIGPGTEREPAIEMESVHHIMKMVAGTPNLRPAWFFDTAEQGEALGDVATHLVDLVPFVLFPGQPVDYRADVKVLGARRWPTTLGTAELLRVTGEKALPAELAARTKDGKLDYMANGEVAWTVKGVHARAKVLWNYEAPAGGGDTHTAVVRGSRARVEIRQGAEEKWRPELYVVPNRPEDGTAVEAALGRRVAALAKERPGLAVEKAGAGFRVVVPDVYRVGHEAHFGEVTRHFLDYLKAPASVPRWETANMLAKYYVTTRAVELSRKP
ncbi:MAG: putative oxidoreductase C-terminal domain-containing protein [Vicinamibacteria bacterium]